MMGDRVVDPRGKAAALRLALLLDEWDRSGNRVRTRCARDVRNVVDADDVLGAFVNVLEGGLDGLDELRELVRTVETVDFGGYTQRDAYAVAAALWAAGYRKGTGG